MKKFTSTLDVNDFEVLTDTGWTDIKSIHTTIDYQVYIIELDNGYSLECADNHIVFIDDNEVYVKDLNVNDEIVTDTGKSKVVSIIKTDRFEEMYDLELTDSSNRRYYTNGILSHNTQLAKEVCKFMFDGEDSMIRIDMSEYMEKFSVSRLVGAPPGYQGYEEGGVLTEAVKRKPYSIILFDEIEKAHPDIFNVLLQVLDDGHLTDGLGRKIDFKNTIIIMTSNVGVKKLTEFGTGVGFGTSAKLKSEKKDSEKMITASLKKAFAPEFLNRLDDVIIFNSLKQEDILKIVDIELDMLASRLKESGYTVSVSKQAKEHLSVEGYDPAYGARPLKRTIQRLIEDPLADEMMKLSGKTKIKVGYTIKSGIIVKLV